MKHKSTFIPPAPEENAADIVRLLRMLRNRLSLQAIGTRDWDHHADLVNDAEACEYHIKGLEKDMPPQTSGGAAMTPTPVQAAIAAIEKLDPQGMRDIAEYCFRRFRAAMANAPENIGAFDSEKVSRWAQELATATEEEMQTLNMALAINGLFAAHN